jgi:hypothetical protein
MFDAMTVILVISFIIWELPRSVKIIAEEYTRGLYPDNGRVVDFVLLAAGILAIAYFVLDNNAEKIVFFLKTPGITIFFIILMIVIPLIIFLGFLKRFFGRMDGNNSVTVFLTHGFLDLMHTLFYISLAVLAIPATGHLLFGPK